MMFQDLHVNPAKSCKSCKQLFRLRSKLVKLRYLAPFAALIIIAFTSSHVFAQEGEMQVNDDVITLSMLKKEAKERIEALKQSGMTEQQAMDEVTKRQNDLIATLINEKLLLQRGK